jgi:ABC-2 type transport system ATP-binding protein
VNTNAIEVRDLSVSPINFLCLNQKDKIIDNVSFNVPKGKLTCFIGHNGAGKTTIVKSILGIRKTSGGTISINGKSFKDVLARENIGYIPEKGNIEKIKAITFLKNISQFYKMGKVDFKERVKHLAEIFNFPVKKLKLRLDKLSSGQNKIITIMQAFLSNPSIIIADEPTDNLDPETRDIF